MSHPATLFEYALDARRRDDAVGALMLVNAAVEAEPDNATIVAERADLMFAMARWQEALADYEHAFALAPDSNLACERGNVLQELGRQTEARTSYETALALDPDSVAARINLASLLIEQREYALALTIITPAIERLPRCAEAHLKRGNALSGLDRLDEALAAYDETLRLDPHNADAMNNKGGVMLQYMRLDEAAEFYRQATELDPDLPGRRMNEGFVHLLQGDFERGLALYEYRGGDDERDAHAKRYGAIPRWSGREPLAGKRLLLTPEQGLGDTLQFVRYADIAAAHGAQVIVEAQAALLPLLARMPSVHAVLPRGAPLPSVDFHCPMMSMPLACGTTLRNIPGTVPYLRADEDKTQEWSRWLAERGSGPHIGLVWSGNPKHGGDRLRSITLAELAPLLASGLSFVSLQKEVRAADKAAFDAASNLLDVSDRLGDFSDTAALAQALDLIIAVDTAPAHLAGALGCPVWIMLPFYPDWRWLCERSDSPWYPTARLFRQPRRADWRPVIEQVAQALYDWRETRTAG